MSTVLYLFDLAPDTNPATYEVWAKSVDIPTLRALPSVRSYRVLRLRGAPGNDAAPAAYQYAEILDVTSVEQLQTELAAPGLTHVTAAFARLTARSTVLTGTDLSAQEQEHQPVPNGESRP